MGFASRRTFAAFAVAVPVAAACVALSGTASAGPEQTGDGKVATSADLKFNPPEITVAAGSKVTWTNADGNFHTVTGGDGSPDTSSPINGQLPAKGATYSVTFDKPGTYKYFCQPHVSVGMKGTVIVTAAGGAGGSASATPSTAGSSAPPASASASATVGAPQEGVGAPTAEPSEGEEPPGIAGNKTIESIEAERAAQHGAVSGFRFFTMVAVAFLVILGAAVTFSTRPRRAGR